MGYDVLSSQGCFSFRFDSSWWFAGAAAAVGGCGHGSLESSLNAFLRVMKAKQPFSHRLEHILTHLPCLHQSMAKSVDAMTGK